MPRGAMQDDGDGRPEAESDGKRPTHRRAADREAARLRNQRDLELVEAVRRGDRKAYRELYEAYHRRVYAIALGVVKNPEDARDIVQEAFVKVHKHLDGFQGGSSFYTWLYRIVMNLAIDHSRRHKRAKAVDFDEGIHKEGDAADGDLGQRAQLEAQNPRRTVLRQELSEKIRAALADLPEYHQAVIVLREVDGLSYEELAEALDVPKGTIMSRLFHARRKMQEALADYLEDDLVVGD